jgi:phytoene desaturase
MNSDNRKNAIVIGAGIAGIAASIRLQLKGYQVLCIENNSYPGGKLSEIKKEGFRFDAGPSLFTMPQYVDELFLLANKNPRDYFKYLALDKTCVYFYEDGTKLTAYADKEKFMNEMQEKLNVSKNALQYFLQKSKTIYDITYHVFLERSLHRLKTFLRWPTIQSIFRLAQIDSMRSMNTANEAILKSDKAVQFFNRYATYNGSNPYKAPATLNVIHHLEYEFGAWLPKYGMYHITDSLVKLAESLGVKFQYQTKVERIIHDQRHVQAIECTHQNKKEIHNADLVISNMDVYHTYKKLLSDIEAPESILNQTKSSSALIFYWGINKTFDELDVHNIFFSKDYKHEFDCIDTGKITNDPSVYINITSKKIISDAPENAENWFVMINVPNNQDQNWDELIATSRENIINKLSRILKTDIAPLIVCEEILDPRSIESKTSSHRGALYGNSSNNQFAAFLRHSNKSSKLKGLYFCGGSVHPGGGIPLALLSAKICTDFIEHVE